MNYRIPVSPFGGGSRTKERGMTLAEVVVALAVASLTVASLVGGYISSTMAAEKSSLTLAANTRAIERLEDTHAATWSLATGVDQLGTNVANVPPTNFPPKVVVLDLSAQSANVTYATNYTTITQVSVTPPLRRIHVDCVWRFRNRQYSTMITNSVETLRGPD
jgi:prepilin-type N-terminal cleavage/methylation domain-containing protein